MTRNDPSGARASVPAAASGANAAFDGLPLPPTMLATLQQLDRLVKQGGWPEHSL